MKGPLSGPFVLTRRLCYGILTPMSLVPEEWAEIARGEESGVPTVIVARTKAYNPVPRLTTWKLQRMRGDWRVRQVFFSVPNAGLDNKPNRLKDYPSGIRLTDSAIDRRLREYCEG